MLLRHSLLSVGIWPKTEVLNAKPLQLGGSAPEPRPTAYHHVTADEIEVEIPSVICCPADSAEKRPRRKTGALLQSHRCCGADMCWTATW